MVPPKRDYLPGFVVDTSYAKLPHFSDEEIKSYMSSINFPVAGIPKEIWTPDEVAKYHSLEGEAKISYAERLNGWRDFAGQVALFNVFETLANKPGGGTLPQSRWAPARRFVPPAPRARPPNQVPQTPSLQGTLLGSSAHAAGPSAAAGPGMVPSSNATILGDRLLPGQSRGNSNRQTGGALNQSRYAQTPRKNGPTRVARPLPAAPAPSQPVVAQKDGEVPSAVTTTRIPPHMVGIKLPKVSPPNEAKTDAKLPTPACVPTKSAPTQKDIIAITASDLTPEEKAVLCPRFNPPLEDTTKGKGKEVVKPPQEPAGLPQAPSQNHEMSSTALKVASPAETKPDVKGNSVVVPPKKPAGPPQTPAQNRGSYVVPARRSSDKRPPFAQTPVQPRTNGAPTGSRRNSPNSSASGSQSTSRVSSRAQSGRSTPPKSPNHNRPQPKPERGPPNHAVRDPNCCVALNVWGNFKAIEAAQFAAQDEAEESTAPVKCDAPMTPQAWVKSEGSVTANAQVTANVAIASETTTHTEPTVTSQPVFSPLKGSTSVPSHERALYPENAPTELKVPEVRKIQKKIWKTTFVHGNSSDGPSGERNVTPPAEAESSVAKKNPTEDVPEPKSEGSENAAELEVNAPLDVTPQVATSDVNNSPAVPREQTPEIPVEANSWWKTWSASVSSGYDSLGSWADEVEAELPLDTHEPEEQTSNEVKSPSTSSEQEEQSSNEVQPSVFNGEQEKLAESSDEVKSPPADSEQENPAESSDEVKSSPADSEQENRAEPYTAPSERTDPAESSAAPTSSERKDSAESEAESTPKTDEDSEDHSVPLTSPGDKPPTNEAKIHRECWIFEGGKPVLTRPWNQVDVALALDPTLITQPEPILRDADPDLCPSMKANIHQIWGPRDLRRNLVQTLPRHPWNRNHNVVGIELRTVARVDESLMPKEVPTVKPELHVLFEELWWNWLKPLNMVIFTFARTNKLMDLIRAGCEVTADDVKAAVLDGSLSAKPALKPKQEAKQEPSSQFLIGADGTTAPNDRTTPIIATADGTAAPLEEAPVTEAKSTAEGTSQASETAQEANEESCSLSIIEADSTIAPDAIITPTSTATIGVTAAPVTEVKATPEDTSQASETEQETKQEPSLPSFTEAEDTTASTFIATPDITAAPVTETIFTEAPLKEALLTEVKATLVDTPQAFETEQEAKHEPCLQSLTEVDNMEAPNATTAPTPTPTPNVIPAPVTAAQVTENGEQSQVESTPEITSQASETAVNVHAAESNGPMTPVMERIDNIKQADVEPTPGDNSPAQKAEHESQHGPKREPEPRKQSLNEVDGRISFPITNPVEPVIDISLPSQPNTESKPVSTSMSTPKTSEEPKLPPPHVRYSQMYLAEQARKATQVDIKPDMKDTSPSPKPSQEPKMPSPHASYRQMWLEACAKAEEAKEAAVQQALTTDGPSKEQELAVNITPSAEPDKEKACVEQSGKDVPPNSTSPINTDLSPFTTESAETPELKVDANINSITSEEANAVELVQSEPDEQKVPDEQKDSSEELTCAQTSNPREADEPKTVESSTLRETSQQNPVPLQVETKVDTAITPFQEAKVTEPKQPTTGARYSVLTGEYVPPHRWYTEETTLTPPMTKSTSIEKAATTHGSIQPVLQPEQKPVVVEVQKLPVPNAPPTPPKTVNVTDPTPVAGGNLNLKSPKKALETYVPPHLRVPPKAKPLSPPTTKPLDTTKGSGSSNDNKVADKAVASSGKPVTEKPESKDTDTTTSDQGVVEEKQTLPPVEVVEEGKSTDEKPVEEKREVVASSAQLADTKVTDEDSIGVKEEAFVPPHRQFLQQPIPPTKSIQLHSGQVNSPVKKDETWQKEVQLQVQAQTSEVSVQVVKEAEGDATAEEFTDKNEPRQNTTASIPLNMPQQVDKQVLSFAPIIDIFADDTLPAIESAVPQGKSKVDSMPTALNDALPAYLQHVPPVNQLSNSISTATPYVLQLPQPGAILVTRPKPSYEDATWYAEHIKPNGLRRDENGFVHINPAPKMIWTKAFPLILPIRHLMVYQRSELKQELRRDGELMMPISSTMFNMDMSDCSSGVTVLTDEAIMPDKYKPSHIDRSVPTLPLIDVVARGAVVDCHAIDNSAYPVPWFSETEYRSRKLRRDELDLTTPGTTIWCLHDSDVVRLQKWLQDSVRLALRQPIIVDKNDPHFRSGQKPLAGVDKPWVNVPPQLEYLPADPPNYDEEAWDSEEEELCKAKRDTFREIPSHLREAKRELTSARRMQIREAEVIKARKVLKREQEKARHEKSFQLGDPRKVPRHDPFGPPLENSGPMEPKADIFARPIRDDEGDQVVELYNNIARNSYDIPDIGYEKREYFDSLIAECREKKFPFFVACTQKSTPRNRRRKLMGHQVYRENIVGFAYVKPYRPESCFAGTVELFVFVDPTVRRLGVGKTLVDRILPALDEGYLSHCATPFYSEDHFKMELIGGGAADATIRKVIVSVFYESNEFGTANLVWKKSVLQKFGFWPYANFPNIGAKDTGVSGNSPGKPFSMAQFARETRNNGEKKTSSWYNNQPMYLRNVVDFGA